MESAEQVDLSWEGQECCCWHEGGAPVRAAVSLHLNYPRLGCDSPSWLELQPLGGSATTTSCCAGGLFLTGDIE